VDDLEAVAASVSDDPVNMLGFSQGAAVAIGVAVRRPGRVARLILHGTSRLFAAHGPDAVTVRQIATAAGLSPALVVHHFGSKEGLREGAALHVPALFERQCVNLRTARGARQRSRSPDGGGAEHQVSGSVRRLPRASHA
jgi:AcrR family transcriptional regulator